MVDNNPKRRKVDNISFDLKENLKGRLRDWYNEEISNRYEGIDELLYSLLSEVFQLVNVERFTSNDVKDSGSSVASAKACSAVKQTKTEFRILSNDAYDGSGVSDDTLKEHRYYISLKKHTHSISGCNKEGDVLNLKLDLTGKSVPFRTMFVMQRFIEVLECLGIHADKPRSFYIHNSSAG